MENIENDSFNENTNFLQEIKKDNGGFKIPSNYFASMQADVLSQFEKPELNNSTSILDRWINGLKIFVQPQYALMGIAGIVLILVSIGINNSSQSVKPDDAFSSLSVEDYEYYFDSDFDNLNNQELMAVLSEDDLINHSQIAPISTVDLPETIADEFIDEIDNTTLLELESNDNQ